MSDNAIGGLFILVAIVGAACYLLPAIIAFARSHHYRWVIVALTIFGGWTGIAWLAALIWSVFPHNRSVVDPMVGPATGVGHRNAGDAVGEARYGLERGYEAERRRSDAAEPHLRPWERRDTPTKLENTVEALERLQRLHSSGALSDEEYEAAKRRVLS